nr:unnamed protein product [Callosobruchus analis]
MLLTQKTGREDTISSKERQRDLRMSDQHYAAHRPFCLSHYSR